jgi:hypothetical protein
MKLSPPKFNQQKTRFRCKNLKVGIVFKQSWPTISSSSKICKLDDVKQGELN